MVRDEIVALSQQLVAAANRGDMTTAATLYTEDAMFSFPTLR